jgi:class 3 adenylate cyclase
VALLEGFDALVTELTAAESRRSLLSQVGEQLEELLHPESMSVYASSAGSFAPVFSAGEARGVGDERSLADALETRSTPLARTRGGVRRAESINPFEWAALETLEAEVVLPLRRRGALDAFISLGRKRSGDVYTSTDLAVLGSLADKASLKLSEFEEETVDERHLAAIVSADVVGYSRLMSRDEQATINTLASRRDLVERLTQEHHGRVVDFVGDNFLAEFPSALDAAGCAIQIQRTVALENQTLAAEHRMEFRIGVHLGDVTVRGDRIYGDGVNVAARLEALAEPGGIWLSAAVRDQVRNRVDLDLQDMGEQIVKNLPEPVHAYAIAPPEVAD